MTATKLPPFHVVEDALRATTDRLTQEIVEPQDHPPAWNEFEWAVARAVAAMHGLSAALAKTLRWRGPDEWHAFLDDQRAQVRTRYGRIGGLLGRIDDAFRRNGIGCVPLKGSALRTLDPRAASERPQSDVDLLVAPVQRDAASEALRSIGYELQSVKFRHEVWQPLDPGSRRTLGDGGDAPVWIELHTRIFESLPVTEVDITASILRTQLAPGLNSYASLEDLMRHVCLHAAGNMCAQAARFSQLQDIARLALRLEPGNWQRLVDGEDCAGTWWLYPPLALAARYFPGAFPGEAVAGLRTACPARLRRRYDGAGLYEVSWSNMRFAALPGLVWTRTSRERMRLAWNRAFPRRTVLEELAETVVNEPTLQRGRWYSVSRAERVLRWLFSRPPRTQTINAVLASLELGSFR